MLSFYNKALKMKLHKGHIVATKVVSSEHATGNIANLQIDKSKARPMSDNSALRLKNVTRRFLECHDVIRSNTEALKCEKTDIVFITLTLPAKQRHSDKEIKRVCLNHFLILLKRELKVKGLTYIWKAERQKNGNIHFHLLFLGHVPALTLRKLWNHTLQKLGYIDLYRKNMLNFTPEKYVEYRKRLFEQNKAKNEKRTYAKKQKFDEAKALAAYNKGLEENFSNPNTTDVKKLSDKKSVVSYVVKYVAKTGDIIGGRHWQASENLESLEACVLDEGWHTLFAIVQHNWDKVESFEKNDFFYVVKLIPGWTIFDLTCPYNLKKDFYKVQERNFQKVIERSLAV